MTHAADSVGLGHAALVSSARPAMPSRGAKGPDPMPVTVGRPQLEAHLVDEEDRRVTPLAVRDLGARVGGGGRRQERGNRSGPIPKSLIFFGSGH